MGRNCWEVKGCERYPGGFKVDKRGPCPASTLVIATGINNGLFGGRSCWAIDKTLCGNKSSSHRKEMAGSCPECEFYSKVAQEEAENFLDAEEIRKELREYQLF